MPTLAQEFGLSEKEVNRICSRVSMCTGVPPVDLRQAAHATRIPSREHTLTLDEARKVCERNAESLTEGSNVAAFMTWVDESDTIYQLQTPYRLGFYDASLKAYVTQAMFIRQAKFECDKKKSMAA